MRFCLFCSLVRAAAFKRCYSETQERTQIFLSSKTFPQGLQKLRAWLSFTSLRWKKAMIKVRSLTSIALYVTRPNSRPFYTNKVPISYRCRKHFSQKDVRSHVFVVMTLLRSVELESVATSEWQYSSKNVNQKPLNFQKFNDIHAI